MDNFLQNHTYLPKLIFIQLVLN